MTAIKDQEAPPFAALMAKAGVDETFVLRLRGEIETRLPAGAVDYLRSDHPYLRELQHKYQLLSCAALVHSQWSDSYVASQVPFHAFRGDCGYVYQHRDFNLPVTYLSTFYYLQANGSLPLLDKLVEDDLFGAYVLDVAGRQISRDRLDSTCEISFLESRLQLSRRSSYQIIDIGSGYGRLAHRLVQAMENVYVTCVDAIPESTFICDYYLRFRGAHSRARTIPLPEFLDAQTQFHYDLAVNVHSFSECTSQAVSWWMDLLRQMKVPHLLVVPNGDGGGQLLTTEVDRSRNDFGCIIQKHGYKLVLREPKYLEPLLQRYGVTPTHYFLFELSN